MIRHKIRSGDLTEEEKAKYELQKKKPCEICGRIFNDPSSLRRHLNTHRGIKPYSCDDCGKAFSEKKQRDEHYNSEHLGMNTKKPCEFCGKEFSHSFSLKQHLKSHTGTRDHVCPDCGSSFYDEAILRAHIQRTHLGIKNHKCPEPECGRTFAEKRKCDDHYNTKHLGLKNYPCEHCGKAFGMYSGLYNHIRSIHGTVPSSRKDTLQQSSKVRKHF